MKCEKCPTCGGRIFGRAKCIVCEVPFSRKHPNQITCASLQCRRVRQLHQQKTWIKELRKSDRFPGESVICLVCGTKAKKKRINQATCLTRKCVTAHRDTIKFRGLRAEHVRD